MTHSLLYVIPSVLFRYICMNVVQFLAILAWSVQDIGNMSALFLTFEVHSHTETRNDTCTRSQHAHIHIYTHTAETKHCKFTSLPFWGCSVHFYITRVNASDVDFKKVNSATPQTYGNISPLPTHTHTQTLSSESPERASHFHSRDILIKPLKLRNMIQEAIHRPIACHTIYKYMYTDWWLKTATLRSDSNQKAFHHKQPNMSADQVMSC